LWKIGLPGLCALSFVCVYTAGQSQKNRTASLPAVRQINGTLGTGAFLAEYPIKEEAPSWASDVQTQAAASPTERIPVGLPLDLTPGTRLDDTLTVASDSQTDLAPLIQAAQGDAPAGPASGQEAPSVVGRTAYRFHLDLKGRLQIEIIDR